jgi:hypothetical protein
MADVSPPPPVSQLSRAVAPDDLDDLDEARDHDQKRII